MHSCREGIFPEIIQPQKGSESNTSHAAFQSSLLGIEPIWKDPLMTGQMQFLIFV